MRVLALAPELLLAGGVTVGYACLLAGGPIAGRLSRFTLLLALAGALAASVLFRAQGDELLFGVYRIDALSQLGKCAMLLGCLVAALNAWGEDRWAAMRVTSPFFHGAAALCLVLTASTVDLLVAPLTWWMAGVAAVLLASSVGRWSVLERIVRRSLGGLMAVTALTLTGVLLTAAASHGTRLDALRAAGEPKLAAHAIGLALWASMALWMIAAAPVQLRRLASDATSSRAAPIIAGTAMIAAGGLIVVRALALAAGRIPDLLAQLLLAAAIAPAFVIAARRFAVSFQKKRPALLTTFLALALAASLLWPWIVTAAGELD